MKSTGLFGKNSGRVGGVVYSNYRGEQVVRTYQPKVNNPSTKKQVEQRAKFKLVSQVSAALGKEIKMSFVPNVQKETPRNAFVKAMLKKAVYADNQASLPIEDIILTNSRVSGFQSIEDVGPVSFGAELIGATENTRVKVVYIGYNAGGEIALIGAEEIKPTFSSQTNTYNFTSRVPQVSGYTNKRALLYTYTPDTTNGTTYEDYEVLEEEATLQDILRVFSGRINFSATENILIPQNV